MGKRGRKPAETAPEVGAEGTDPGENGARGRGESGKSEIPRPFGGTREFVLVRRDRRQRVEVWPGDVDGAGRELRFDGGFDPAFAWTEVTSEADARNNVRRFIRAGILGNDGSVELLRR